MCETCEISSVRYHGHERGGITGLTHTRNQPTREKRKERKKFRKLDWGKINVEK